MDLARLAICLGKVARRNMPLAQESSASISGSHGLEPNAALGGKGKYLLMIAGLLL